MLKYFQLAKYILKVIFDQSIPRFPQFLPVGNAETKIYLRSFAMLQRKLGKSVLRNSFWL